MFCTIKEFFYDLRYPEQSAQLSGRCLLYTSFNICQKVFSYTNHTVMAEALEKWNVDIFKMTLPRIYQIVVEMDRRARAELEKVFPGDKGKIDYMALIGDNQVRMANICAYTANTLFVYR